MLAIVGYLMLAALAVLLVRGKLIPSIVLTVIPIIGAIIVGTNLTDMMTFVAKGVIGVLPVVALFVFSITYFGIMFDVGLFDRIISFLVKRIGKSIYSVLCVTALIAMIAHLDGSGVATLLITVPAMLPVYDALKIRRLPLALTVSLVISVMNMLPWGGPSARAATVINIDPVVLWQHMLPVQIIGIALIFVALFFIARIEKRRGEFNRDVDIQANMKALSDEEKSLKRPKLWWPNLILTIILLAALILGIPSFIAFMVGCAIAIPMNFRTTKEQNARLKAHAKNILPMVITIMSAGALLGVLNGTGMVEAMSNALLTIVPNSLKSMMHVIIGVLTTPISVLLDADTMMYGILPIVVNAAGTAGISAISVASIFVIGHNFGITLCMTSAAVYFGLGLYGLEYKDAFKYSILWTVGMGTVMILLSAVLVM